MRPYPELFNQACALLDAGRYAEYAEFVRPLAEAGVAWAQGCMGSLYQCGLGVPVDYEQARFWLILAASQGDGLACHNLSVLETVHAAGEASEFWREEADKQGWDLIKNWSK